MKTPKAALLATAFAAVGLVMVANGSASATQYNPASPCDIAPHGFSSIKAYGQTKDGDVYNLMTAPAQECAPTDWYIHGVGMPIGCKTTNYYGNTWYWIGEDEKTADGGWIWANNITNVVGTPPTCY